MTIKLLGSIAIIWLMSGLFIVDSVTTEDEAADYFDDIDDMDFDNATNCTNEDCIPDEDYIGLMVEYIFPDLYDWILIAMHSVVFVLGLVGNALVCLAVYRNHSMRTVTNYFIVNLAVADLLVILICLPPTVVWDVTETWFLGLRLCKTVLYFQIIQKGMNAIGIHIALPSGIPQSELRVISAPFLIPYPSQFCSNEGGQRKCVSFSHISFRISSLMSSDYYVPYTCIIIVRC